MGRKSISYAEFIQMVRRYRTVDVIQAVASFSAGISEPESGIEKWLHASPWGLAKIAKESIIAGSDYFRNGKDLGPEEILHLHNAFANTADSPRHLDEQSLGRQILLQMSYEQFVYGVYDHDSWARSLALMHFTPLRHPEIEFDQKYIFDLFNMPLLEAVNALWIIAQVCRLTGGVWRDDLLQSREMQAILEWVPLQSLLDVRHQISKTISEFKTLAAERGEGQGSPYRRWEANPLVAYPLVDLLDGRFVAPQYRLISKLAAPDSLAYRGVLRQGDEFTGQLGPIFEQYVGDQFKLLPNVTVDSEVKFRVGKKGLASIDWFVELQNCILLVEAKSARPNEAVRSGRAEPWTAYELALGKAYKQISDTKNYIESGHEAFKKYRNGKKLIGLVVTLEPFYLANSGLFMGSKSEYGMPILQLSASELEQLVLIDPIELGKLLDQIVSSPELAMQDLMTSAKTHFDATENPYLAEAKSSIRIMSAQKRT